MDDKIKIIVKTIAENESLHDYQFETVDDGSSKGEGYLGVITNLKITGRNNRDEKQTLNCIVKSAFNNETLRNGLPIQHSYTTETRMYANIFPSLKLFQNEKLNKLFTFEPKFYYACSESRQETIILENLKVLGYELHPLNCSMNDDHITLVLKKYARFHAISFALRDQQPKKFKELTNDLKDGYFPFLMKTLRKSVTSVCERSLSSLNPDTDSKAYEKYKTFISNLDGFYEEIMNVDTDKYCVILHGDCWTNNMMFNYQDERNPKQPTSVRFIDFQMSRLGFPAIDVANFMYTNSSKEVLDNLDYYLEFYYKCLSEHLTKLGSDAEELYPFDLLKQHLRKYSRFTLFLIPMLLQVSSKDHNPDLQSVAESSGDIGNAFGADVADMDSFNDKMRHTILHFVKHGAL